MIAAVVWTLLIAILVCVAGGLALYVISDGFSRRGGHPSPPLDDQPAEVIERIARQVTP